MTEHPYRCGDFGNSRPLTIASDQAGYLGAIYVFDGMVGSQGELVMRSVSEPVKFGEVPGIERIISGKIDGNGTLYRSCVSL
jgi:hypothetical protein